MDAVTPAGREPGYPELDPEITQRMKTAVVNRDGSLLRTIATKIDQDPEPAFLLLDISRGAIFQEKESLKGRYISEYYSFRSGWREIINKPLSLYCTWLFGMLRCSQSVILFYVTLSPIVEANFYDLLI